MNTYKKLTLGAMLIASIALTGCAQEVPEFDGTNDAPAVVETQKSDTADEKQADETQDAGDNTRKSLGDDVNTEEEVEKAAKTPFNEQPFGYDPAVLVENASDETKAIFGDLDMEEGVRTALVNFRTIQTVSNFSEKRDGSKDAAIIRSFSDIMTKGLVDGLVAESNDEDGFDNIVAAFPDGTISDPNGNRYQITSGTPNIIIENVHVYASDVQNNGQQDLVVAGDIAYLFTVEGNKGAMMKGEFKTTVAPTEGGWITTDMFVSMSEWDLTDLDAKGSDA